MSIFGGKKQSESDKTRKHPGKETKERAKRRLFNETDR